MRLASSSFLSPNLSYFKSLFIGIYEAATRSLPILDPL